eukprot:COSAG02_NODE_41205_length_397_cov_0.681208_1_plen_50_part_10
MQGEKLQIRLIVMLAVTIPIGVLIPRLLTAVIGVLLRRLLSTAHFVSQAS